MSNERNNAVVLLNRHMARLLTNLEQAGCPVLFRNEVKSELVWLRSDICNTKGTDHDDIEPDGNH
jgi:hypothetical protein